MILLSWARSPEKFDDSFLESADDLYSITIGDEDGMELLFPLLRSWVRTCRAEEAPVVSQFATIAVIEVPQCLEYDIRFCSGMVPVLKAIYADIFRDQGLHPNTPVLNFT